MTLDGSLGDMEFFGNLLVRQSDDTAQPEHLAPLRGHSLHFIGDHPLEILHVIGILRLGMNLSDIFKHIEMQRTFIICLGPEIVRNFMTCQEIDECVEILVGIEGFTFQPEPDKDILSDLFGMEFIIDDSAL